MRLAAVVLFLLALSTPSAAEVTDGWQRSIALGEPPQRIVALAPHLTETLFAIGAGDRIVATVSFSDHPPAAREVPRLGDAFALSRESLVAVRPDMVLAWGAALTPARLADLEALGVPVYVSAPDSLAAVAREMATLARLTGGDATRAADFAARLEALPAVNRELAVLPLISVRPPMTLSREHFVGDLLSRCGARNPLAGRAGPVIRISAERLLRAEADLVVNLSGEPLPRDLRLPPGAAVAALDPDLLVRPGPRVIEGAEQLCALLRELH